MRVHYQENTVCSKTKTLPGAETFSPIQTNHQLHPFPKRNKNCSINSLATATPYKLFSVAKKKESTKVQNTRRWIIHTYTLYGIRAPFTLTTIYLLLALVVNSRQLNLPRGNLNDWQWRPWPCKSEKQAITREESILAKSASWKPWGFSEDLAGKFKLSHTRLTLALEW